MPSFRRVRDLAEARRLWEGDYVRALTHCSHPHCSLHTCTVGKRLRTLYVLTGDLIPLWSQIRSRVGGRKRVIRVDTTTGHAPPSVCVLE